MKKLYVLTLIVVSVFSFSSISFATQAEDFDSYVDYKQVQHRTYWDKKNKLYNKIWRLVFGISPAVDRGNVSDPDGFDELISKIKDITISFETTDDTCNDCGAPLAYIESCHRTNQSGSRSKKHQGTEIVVLHGLLRRVWKEKGTTPETKRDIKNN